MAAIITQKFRVHNAKQFKQDISTDTDSETYIFIGRSYPWADDTAPPTPNNGIGEEIDAWNDMIALKKVGTADTSHAIKRYDWASDTKYSEYQHDISSTNLATEGGSISDLYSSKFYVMTDEYHVYKCIRTGRDAAGATVNSTTKPQGTSATVLIAGAEGGADGFGYLWKYMYTISASDTIKFVTNEFIPVKTLGAQTEIDGISTNGGFGGTGTDDSSAQYDVETAAVDGAIDHVVVTARGTSYNEGTYSEIDIKGDGSLAQVVVTVNSAGNVSDIKMENELSEHGTGYTKATLDIDAISGIGGNANATAKVIISPKIGHGADPVQELGGNYMMVNARLEFAEGSGDFPIDNDFRRIGLIQDPFATGTTVLDATTAFAYNKMTLASVTDLAVDDTVRDTNNAATADAVGKVISITGTVVSYITQVNAAGTYSNFSNGDTAFEGTSNLGAISLVTAPEVVANSGQIMYIENRGAVTRASDQIEDIKLIIEM